MGSPSSKQLNANELAAIAKMPFKDGMNTLDILSNLFKGLYEGAMKIPSTDPVLRGCMELKYSPSRNEFIVSLLEPPNALSDMLPRIENGLKALESLKKPELQLRTKEFAPMKDDVAKYREKREACLQDYEKLIHERDKVVIPHAIARLIEALDQPNVDLSRDQIIRNERERVRKMLTDLLYKAQQIARDKTTLTKSLVTLHDNVLESIPPEQRPGSFIARKGPETGPAARSTTPRLNE